MIVGYARTSTLDQVAGFDAQLRELTAAGVEKIYREHASSVAERAELQAGLEFVRDGDIFIVTKLDRLARSVADLTGILQFLETKKVGLRILQLGLDTQTATGRLMVTVLGAVAQFEREMMLERQREGINKAKAEGKYRGRRRITEQRYESIVTLINSGLSRTKTARCANVSLATVYRVLAEQRKAKA